MSLYNHLPMKHTVAEGTFTKANDLPKATVPCKTPLELKLELLERRFTMPPNSIPPVAPLHSNITSTTTLDSSMNPLGLPILQQDSTDKANSSSTASHHKLSFDTPSIPFQTLNQSVNANSTDNGNVTMEPTNEFKEASEESFSAMNEYPNILDMGMNNESFLSDKTNNSHHSQSSNHTILTGHTRPKYTIVHETPPESSESLSADLQQQSLVSKIQEKTETIVKSVELCTQIDGDKNRSFGHNGKRKSIPIKRQTPSVKSTTNPGSLNVHKDSTNNSVLTASNSKRKRLDFDTVGNLSPTSSDQLSAVNTTTTCHESEHDKSPIARQRDVISPNSRRVTDTGNSNLSPLLLSRSDNSRDNVKSSKNSQKVKSNTLPNNMSLYKFFSTAPKKDSNVAKLEDKLVDVSVKTDAHVLPNKELNNHMSLDSTQIMDEKTVSTSVFDQHLAELEQWKRRCFDLERSCRDKDEQLKAVANNRTILHSALKTTVLELEEQIRKMENEREMRNASVCAELEKFVRNDADQQARELREKLAADGARLGRIVYTRAGGIIGRTSHVESWEDGHATKELSMKRLSLAAKRNILEQRQQAALLTYENLKKQNIQSTSGEGSSPTNAFSIESATTSEKDIRILLDGYEAVESTKIHLLNILKQEQELDREEQLLNDEKGTHIRALKRVASEDSSRFRSRPKLHDRYILQELLGKGGFSEVWRAYDLLDLREVAVKIHQLDPRWPDSKKENYTKHVSREYEIHRNVRHPRIVSLYDVFEIDSNSFATVLECCNGTDLDTLLKTRRRIPEQEARSILLQIISGMRYLSHPSVDGKRQGIIHYDLKPGNILFDEYGDAKITDFGLSKIIDTPDPTESMELTSQGAGTYWYLPPECFFTAASVRISNKVDVWSIGVIFFQMLYGKRPFGEGLSQEKLFSNQTMLEAQEVRFPDRPVVTTECKNFIRSCLTYDQSFRPNVAQLCEHAYVSSQFQEFTES